MYAYERCSGGSRPSGGYGLRDAPFTEQARLLSMQAARCLPRGLRLRTIAHKYVSAAHGLASHYVHIRASACMAAPCITNMRARMHGCVAATASLARDGGRRAAVLAQLQRIGQVMDLAMAPHGLCCVLCCEPSCVCGLVLR